MRSSSRENKTNSRRKTIKPSNIRTKKSSFTKTKKKSSFKRTQNPINLTVVSNDLPLNTQVQVLNFLKNMNTHVQKISYDDLRSFAKENKEFLNMKLNGHTLKKILGKTSKEQFKQFQENMNKLKTVTRKSLTGGALALRRKSSNSSPRSRSPKENNQILGYIKTVNKFLDNSDVKEFIIKISVLMIFLAFVVMVLGGLIRADKPITLPDLGENTIITLGTTSIIGIVVVVSVKNITSTVKDTVLRKQEIQQHMQEQYLQTVNNSAVTYGARGFAAMPSMMQGQMGMPSMTQGQMGMPSMTQGQMGMPSITRGQIGYNNHRSIGY